MSSFSDYAENKILDHAWGRAEWKMPEKVFLALLTVVPTDASTGASITEAGYTGYKRVQVNAADLNAASGGSISNKNEIKFPECTGGSSKVVAWALLDAEGAGEGNIISWGTVTETEISTTQNTIPTVAAGGLSNSQD